MLNQKDFFAKYRIQDEAFEKSGFSWADIEAIYADYAKKQDDLLMTRNLIAGRLEQIEEVHSLKARIKDPEHLIEKIIRKKLENPEREISLDNYQNEITDLVGVRGLHLFKDDWLPIHTTICETWEFHEEPTINIRKGDASDAFDSKGCKVFEHKHGYRSVHYLVKLQPTKNIFVAEIQIRTLFEEGWSEIDHRLRYPYDTDNHMLTEYLAIFNRLAGSADEMGTFIKLLKDKFKADEMEFAAQKQENERVIQKLEHLEETVKLKDEEKKQLQDVIDSLRTHKTGISSHFATLIPGASTRVNLDYIVGSSGLVKPPDYSDHMRSLASPFAQCTACGKPLTPHTSHYCTPS